ncbi:MAG: tRNA lysidine(34) synthetase TilS [Thermoanaerobaculia bacterium]
MQPSEAAERFFRDAGIESGSLLLALSGGVDSTALALILHDLAPALHFKLAAAHVNHHLRGDESDGDEHFVRDLCDRFEIPLEVVDGPLDPKAVRARGVEAAARETRYRILRDVRERRGSDFIVTAHQRDDQIETLLFRLFTGRGVHRLGGIVPRTADLLRPLLGVPRSALRDYLAERGITAREDSSNADTRFVRNLIRHELLPLARRINPAVDEAIAATADDARATAAALRHLAKHEAAAWVKEEATSARFASSARPDDAIVRRVLLRHAIARLDPAGAREVSASDLARIDEAMPDLRRTHVTAILEMFRDGNEVVLELRNQRPAAVPFSLLIEPGTTVEIAQLGRAVTLRQLPSAAPLTNESRSRQVFQLPPGSGRHFSLRNRRPGDRFVPLGSTSEKKLKDFLIDRKIPVEVRDRLPLLVCDDRIVWVGGVEVSELFKVTDRSQPMFEVRLD